MEQTGDKLTVHSSARRRTWSFAGSAALGPVREKRRVVLHVPRSGDRCLAVCRCAREILVVPKRRRRVRDTSCDAGARIRQPTPRDDAMMIVVMTISMKTVIRMLVLRTLINAKAADDLVRAPRL